MRARRFAATDAEMIPTSWTTGGRWGRQGGGHGVGMVTGTVPAGLEDFQALGPSWPRRPCI
jgi:hypothetical protein